MLHTGRWDPSVKNRTQEPTVHRSLAWEVGIILMTQVGMMVIKGRNSIKLQSIEGIEPAQLNINIACEGTKFPTYANATE